MKVLFRNILNKKTLLVLTSGYLCYNMKNVFIKCDSEFGGRFGKDSISDIENEINKQEDIPDLPFDMMDEDALAEMQSIMENPDANPEAYQELMATQMGSQPPPFKNFNQSYKCHSDSELWNGLKLAGTYSPVQSFKFDAESIIEQNAKNTKFSFVSMNQSKTDPTKSLVIVGRNDPSYINSLQLHATITQKDRISLISNFKSTDSNQSIMEAEYNRTMERLNLSVKYSNQGSSVSLTANAYKNLHFGIETHIHPKTGEILYSYGVNHKPHKKCGYALMYLSYVPMISFDFIYMHTRNSKYYFTASKNYNPMVAMTGQNPTEIKLSTEYKQQDGELTIGFNNSFVLSSNLTYKFNKYFAVNLCAEIIPTNIPRRRKIIKTFGVGFTGNYESIQSLMEVEEDFSDYEYEKL